MHTRTFFGSSDPHTCPPSHAPPYTNPTTHTHHHHTPPYNNNQSQHNTQDPAAHCALPRLPPRGDDRLRRLRHRAAGITGKLFNFWEGFPMSLEVRTHALVPFPPLSLLSLFLPHSHAPGHTRTLFNQTPTTTQQIRPIIQSTMAHVDRLDLLKACHDIYIIYMHMSIKKRT